MLNDSFWGIRNNGGEIITMKTKHTARPVALWLGVAAFVLLVVVVASPPIATAADYDSANGVNGGMLFDKFFATSDDPKAAVPKFSNAFELDLFNTVYYLIN